MIRCKLALDADCGKVCCCAVCEDKGTCNQVCDISSEYEKCENAVHEGNEMVAFESQSFAIIQVIADIASKKKILEEQDKEMRKQLGAAMDQYGIKAFENDLIKITYVEPTIRTSVDSTKLKKKYPDIFNECSENSSVKGSVRITVK